MRSRLHTCQRMWPRSADHENIAEEARTSGSFLGSNAVEAHMAVTAWVWRRPSSENSTVVLYVVLEASKMTAVGRWIVCLSLTRAKERVPNSFERNHLWKDLRPTELSMNSVLNLCFHFPACSAWTQPFTFAIFCELQEKEKESEGEEKEKEKRGKQEELSKELDIWEVLKVQFQW